jgi:hypothetical protein
VRAVSLSVGLVRIIRLLHEATGKPTGIVTPICSSAQTTKACGDVRKIRFIAGSFHLINSARLNASANAQYSVSSTGFQCSKPQFHTGIRGRPALPIP